MTRAPAAAARSINSAAAENKDSRCPSVQWRGICGIKTAYGWEGHMRNENSIWLDRAQIDLQDADASGNRSPTRAMEGHMRN